MQLNGNGFDPDGSLVQYGWSFSDWAVVDAMVAVATSAVEAATTHVYGMPGVYQLGFSVTDNGGATMQAKSSVTVWTYTPTATFTPTPTPTNAPPRAFFFYAPKAGGAPLLVELGGSGFDPDGILTEYRWSFMNAGVVDATGVLAASSIENATVHVYGAPGVYPLAFGVVDSGGAVATATGEVVVWTPTPTFTFTATPTRTQTNTPTATASSTPSLGNAADINRDGVVDQLDLFILMQFWRMTTQ